MACFLSIVFYLLYSFLYTSFCAFGNVFLDLGFGLICKPILVTMHMAFMGLDIFGFGFGGLLRYTTYMRWHGIRLSFLVVGFFFLVFGLDFLDCGEVGEDGRWEGRRKGGIAWDIYHIIFTYTHISEFETWIL
jgi:hypothetical protein